MLPRTEVAIMTGHGSIETAVHAMKLGAYDYISKAFSALEEMRMFLRRMAEKVRLVEENQFLRERVDAETSLRGIIGASANIQDVLRMISRLKDTRTPVLVTGESGTGKELVARAIHFRGSFAKRALCRCGLRFAGAHLDGKRTVRLRKRRLHRAPSKPKAGFFRRLTAAPFFWMKLASCRWKCKPNCCASCRKRKFVRWAAMRKMKVDVRVIAATNRDLEADYRNGTFRKDLYFRLNVVTVYTCLHCANAVRISPCWHMFLDRYARGANMQMTPAAMKILLQYDWPGNVRELENCIARAVALGDRELIDVLICPLHHSAVNADHSGFSRHPASLPLRTWRTSSA